MRECTIAMNTSQSRRAVSSLSVLLFSALLVVSIFLVSTANLPENIAIHFGKNGLADAWKSRQEYRFLIVLALASFPLLLVALLAGLPLLTNGRGQIPNHEYWFTEERRKPTATFLITHACWLGCLTVAVIYGVHVTIVQANSVSPPILNTNRLMTILVIYLCGLVWWMSTFLRHFQISTQAKS
jgi:uncharacterized membrane protein